MEKALRKKLQELKIVNIDEIIEELRNKNLLKEASNNISIIEEFLKSKGISFHKQLNANIKSIEQSSLVQQQVIDVRFNANALNQSSSAQKDEKNQNKFKMGK